MEAFPRTEQKHLLAVVDLLQHSSVQNDWTLRTPDQLCRKSYLVISIYFPPLRGITFKEFIAGDSQRSDQTNKLLEIHHTILIVIQFTHNLLHHASIIGALKGEQQV